MHVLTQELSARPWEAREAFRNQLLGRQWTLGLFGTSLPLTAGMERHAFGSGENRKDPQPGVDVSVGGFDRRLAAEPTEQGSVSGEA